MLLKYFVLKKSISYNHFHKHSPKSSKAWLNIITISPNKNRYSKAIASRLSSEQQRFCLLPLSSSLSFLWYHISFIWTPWIFSNFIWFLGFLEFYYTGWITFVSYMRIHLVTITKLAIIFCFPGGGSFCPGGKPLCSMIREADHYPFMLHEADLLVDLLCLGGFVSLLKAVACTATRSLFQVPHGGITPLGTFKTHCASR